jgi:hypothetical protein
VLAGRLLVRLRMDSRPLCRRTPRVSKERPMNFSIRYLITHSGLLAMIVWPDWSVTIARRRNDQSEYSHSTFLARDAERETRRQVRRGQLGITIEDNCIASPQPDDKQPRSLNYCGMEFTTPFASTVRYEALLTRTHRFKTRPAVRSGAVGGAEEFRLMVHLRVS